MLWHNKGRQKKDVAALAGVSRPTVDLWLERYTAEGIAGLLDRPRGAGREQVPTVVRARILALSRTSPPSFTGLSHWSSRVRSAFITRTEGVVGVPSLRGETVAGQRNQTSPARHVQGQQRHEFAEKVADIVGLYLDPPGGAVVLSVDERRRSRRWTGPSRCCRSRSTRPRNALTTIRNGTTNLFAALNVGTDQVVGLAFLKKVVKPYAGNEVHVVLDNLSTHTTPQVMAWLADNPHVRFHFTPKGSSWINQIERGSGSSPVGPSVAGLSVRCRS